jgi:hypothetical protein
MHQTIPHKTELLCNKKQRRDAYCIVALHTGCGVGCVTVSGVPTYKNEMRDVIRVMMATCALECVRKYRAIARCLPGEVCASPESIKWRSMPY